MKPIIGNFPLCTVLIFSQESPRSDLMRRINSFRDNAFKIELVLKQLLPVTSEVLRIDHWRADTQMMGVQRMSVNGVAIKLQNDPS
jgi:hypothetical protein